MAIQLDNNLPQKTFRAGESIVWPGDGSKRIYLLLSGSTEVLADDVLVGRIDQPGALIGEIAALLDQDRTATVKATSETVCATIDDLGALAAQDKELYWEVTRDIARKYVTTLQTILTLKKAILARAQELQLDPSRLPALGAVLTRWEKIAQETTAQWPSQLEVEVEGTRKVTLQAGEVLTREGEPCDKLYFLDHGHIAYEQKDQPEEMPACTEPGAFIEGEDCVLLGLPLMSTARAATESVVKVVDDPKALFEQNPAVGLAFAKLCAQRLTLLTRSLNTFERTLRQTISETQGEEKEGLEQLAETFDKVVRSVQSTLMGNTA